MVKIKCYYCNNIFDYSEEEIKWIPVYRYVTFSEDYKDYVINCKNCGKKIEFTM